MTKRALSLAAGERGVRRRDFIKGIVAGPAAVWTLIAHAPRPDRVRRVGVLMPFTANDPEAQ